MWFMQFTQNSLHLAVQKKKSTLAIQYWMLSCHLHKNLPKNERSEWKSLSHIRLFATPCTIQSTEFSRPEYWSSYWFPFIGHLPNLGMEPRSPALQADSLPAEPPGKPIIIPSCEWFNTFYLTWNMSWATRKLEKEMATLSSILA